MVVTLSEVNAWCRVDTDDDLLIAGLDAAAREFLEISTGCTFEGADVPARARTAIMALAPRWYEQREAAITGNASLVPMHVRSIIHQFRDWSELTDSGEGGMTTKEPCHRDGITPDTRLVQRSQSYNIVNLLACVRPLGHGNGSRDSRI